ncbi:MAG: hypothetical protein ACXW04_13300 [Methylobacter sp.]
MCQRAPDQSVEIAHSAPKIKPPTEDQVRAGYVREINSDLDYGYGEICRRVFKSILGPINSKSCKSKMDNKQFSSWRQLKFDEAEGFPFGEDLFYECQVCFELVPSLPSKVERNAAVECQCGNVYVDADAGRLYVDKPGSVRLYKRSA